MKAADEAKKKKAATASSGAISFDFGKYFQKITSFLARNFFTRKFAALVIGFVINFMLLFYKVSQVVEDSEEVEDDGMAGLGLEEEDEPIEMTDVAEVGEDGGDDGDGGEDEDVEEYIHVEEQFYYLEYIISILGLIHALLSFCMLIAYYNLKIPLAIFKREKEVARKMEFDGIYISEQPEDDNLKGHWDKLVISAKSFPVNYWDKFVKKRVREKYSEMFEFDALCEILGMEKSAIPSATSEETGIIATLKSVDWRYQLWEIGVTVTDNNFLYLLFYFIFSVLGNYNYFFFAAHLIDVAVGVPALRIILQAITYNGKELVLTVGLLSITFTPCWLSTSSGSSMLLKAKREKIRIKSVMTCSHASYSICTRECVLVVVLVTSLNHPTVLIMSLSESSLTFHFSCSSLSSCLLLSRVSSLTPLVPSETNCRVWRMSCQTTASYVVLARTTLTRYRTGSTFTCRRSITWPTICSS